MRRAFAPALLIVAVAASTTACTGTPEPKLRRTTTIERVLPAAPQSSGPSSLPSSLPSSGLSSGSSPLPSAEPSDPVLGLSTAELGDEGDQTSDPTPTAAAAGPAWVPVDPLPPAEPTSQGRPVDIVLSPHPDDETLSLGVWIANRVTRGERVIVVALTDGRATGAAVPIGRRLGKVVDRDRIAAARVLEMRSAAAALGVAAADVYTAHLDTDASPGGSRATVAEVADVIAAFAERFPRAQFSTMSYLAEHHKDHLNAGQALLQAWRAGQVAQAEFAVSRLYWNQPLPGEHFELPGSTQARERVVAAARAYAVWDPVHGRLGVGWYSVRAQFEALVSDPVDHLHDPESATATDGPPPSG